MGSFDLIFFILLLSFSSTLLKEIFIAAYSETFSKNKRELSPFFLLILEDSHLLPPHFKFNSKYINMGFTNFVIPLS